MMELPGVGSGPAGADRTMAARDLVPPVTPPAIPVSRNLPSAADSVGALLRELAQADITRLLGIVEAARTPAQEAQAGQLLQNALSAIAEQNPVRALEQLRQLAVADPVRAENLAAEPSLATVRPGVEQLLAQLTAAAKLKAEGRLTEATHLLETTTMKDWSADRVKPEVFVIVATRLWEAGGLANYTRSEAVSRTLLEEARWAPTPHMEFTTAQKSRGEVRIPLKLLLMGWLALGLAAGGVCWWLQVEHIEVVGSIWLGGLLVLACFGAWQKMQI